MPKPDLRQSRGCHLLLNRINVNCISNGQADVIERLWTDCTVNCIDQLAQQAF